MEIEKNIVSILPKQKPKDFPFKSEEIFRMSDTPKAEDLVLNAPKKVLSEAVSIINVIV